MAASPSAAPRSSAPWLPWALALAGLAVLYGPTLRDLVQTIWSTDEQGHGPVVLLLCAWLFWRQRQALAGAAGEPDATRPGWAWAWLAVALLLHVFGRSQRILSAQALSAIPALMAVLLMLRGPQAVKAVWFPLFFMLFLVPLPAALVEAVTQPMKLAVSTVAANLLYSVGYPVARSGVILQVGPYQLLVADACAGLYTLFTLEAMGLLYLNVVRSSSLLRNVLLALAIVPISFVANVIRVIALSLITYHLGDAAGQGFLHGLAGIVLFLSALMLIVACDSLLRWLRPSA
ncbi:exosortase B [Ideonella sp.]|uniref:exosortase B n=1 Tax=Ideonella sp. TaxID=1929293 RepID=UPI002B46FC6A|nr:exosortase B [Ideonella sp.]HJV70889.1 exosortase B [Ideonella sp.]